MNVNSIAIEVTNNAFLPEAYAYRDYFIEKGFKCDFVNKGDPILLDYDCVLLFHGFHPFWKKYPKFIIGEYNSLSTGRYNRVKDLVKRLINVRPTFYIFLSEDVRKKIWFPESANYLTRSMGYSKADFEAYQSEAKEFDVVYCGSCRPGLITEIKSLADMGLSIALVGPEEVIQHKNITSFGRKTPQESKKIIAKAKYGLNYTPDIFPLNIQDSTKVIEYCAANIGVITNRYEWINKFEKSRSGKFLTLDNIKSRMDVESFDFITPDVSDLEWNDLLNKTKIISKIKAL